MSENKCDTIDTIKLNLNLFGLLEIADRLLSSGENLCGLIPYLENYNEDDWKKYIKFSDDHYKRNLIVSTDYTDVYLICWKKDQKTKPPCGGP